MLEVDCLDRMLDYRRAPTLLTTDRRSDRRSARPIALRRISCQARSAGVQFGDFESPPDVLARPNHCQTNRSLPWGLLPYRARRRLANRAKRWLNTQAVECMTAELLNQRDPEGEVVSWLRAIRRLAGVFTDTSR